MIELNQVQIRALVKTDLPALEWEGEYRHFQRLYADIYQSTCTGRALMWVAVHSMNGLIGQLFIQLVSARIELADGVERAYIYGFRIKPAYRRQGLGKRMMAVAENDLARRNFRLVTLNVARDNPDARRLYENLGYQVVGLDPGQWAYLDDQGIQRQVIEPAWRMEKKIAYQPGRVNI